MGDRRKEKYVFKFFSWWFCVVMNEGSIGKNGMGIEQTKSTLKCHSVPPDWHSNRTLQKHYSFYYNFMTLHFVKESFYFLSGLSDIG